jgi:hypothetical protein
VRTEIDEIRRRLTALGDALSDAGAAVAATPKEATPEETIAALTPAQRKIATARQGVGGAIAKVEETKQTVQRTLRGGQPGPLVGALEAVKQVPAWTHVEGHTAGWMHQHHSTHADLYINKVPCEIGRAKCRYVVRKLLPPGSVLDVHFPIDQGTVSTWRFTAGRRGWSEQ